MKFLADESVEGPVVARLREAGLDVSYVAELAPGTTDSKVMRLAHRASRLLITNDKDFAALAFLQRQASSGIVLVRMPTARSSKKADRLIEVITGRRSRLREAMTVIEADIARHRPLPRTRL